MRETSALVVNPSTISCVRRRPMKPLTPLSLLIPGAKERAKQGCRGETGLIVGHMELVLRRMARIASFRIQKPTSNLLIPKLWRNSAFPLCQSDNARYWWFPYPVSLRTQRSLEVKNREVRLPSF
ncbi:hypothetical protein BU25DRAFT_111488 [Macroventuria anomochaeta]|uniref:Uncharacterized protein n=1 Tax=Macroventuria anomochaeta TaxID=301207 RepID=A0ACB6RUZ4_9PLEO|nr:uncharacterized protein BU25DRAFT_111488 [Macroventuria anomochaeta]KAF2625800.1 hypothetical protein BU25DRAFT_111488 [Macroventuria anomochaeta]